MEQLNVFAPNHCMKFTNKIKVNDLGNLSMNLIEACMRQIIQYFQTVKNVLNTLPHFAWLIGQDIVYDFFGLTHRNLK